MNAPRMDASHDNFIRRLPVMAGLDEAALQFLGGLTNEANYPAGGVIVQEGEPGDRVFFVCTGRVRVVKAAAGEPAVQLAEFGPGDFFLGK